MPFYPTSSPPSGPRVVALTDQLMAQIHHSNRETTTFLSRLLDRPASSCGVVKLQQHVAVVVATPINN